MSSVERRRIILEELADDPSTPARQRRDALAELAELDAAAARPIFADEVASMPADEVLRDAVKLRRPVRAPKAAWDALQASAHVDEPAFSFRLAQLVDVRVRERLEAAVAERTRRLVEEAAEARAAEAEARGELTQVRRQLSQALAAGDQPALPPGRVEAEEAGEDVPVQGQRALPPAGSAEAGFPRPGERRSVFISPFPSRGGLFRRG